MNAAPCNAVVGCCAVQGESVKLPVAYVTGNWSECSVQCGHGGIQRRSVVCMMLGDGWALDVVQSYCDATTTLVQRPITERDCGYVDICPRWTTSEWRQVAFSVSCVKSLTLLPPILLRLYTLPYWSNPPFLIFDIRALWRSVLSARAPECQKLTSSSAMAERPRELDQRFQMGGGSI